MPASSLPPSFVRATLVALDLPGHLAERYAAPETRRAPPDGEHHRHTPPLPPVRQLGAPSWPFPDC